MINKKYMGRFYNGDINGKFMFGIQSSKDAEHFGGLVYEPQYATFEFFKEDLPDIEKGVNKCIKQLGIYKNKIDEFFSVNNYYNDKTLARYLEVSTEKVTELLTVYARLKLGNKILKCVKETGQCIFNADY